MHKAALLLPITALGFYTNITMVLAEEPAVLTQTEISATYDADKRACLRLNDDARDQCQLEARDKREAARQDSEQAMRPKLSALEAATATTMLPAR